MPTPHSSSTEHEGPLDDPAKVDVVVTPDEESDEGLEEEAAGPDEEETETLVDEAASPEEEAKEALEDDDSREEAATLEDRVELDESEAGALAELPSIDDDGEADEDGGVDDERNDALELPGDAEEPLAGVDCDDDEIADCADEEVRLVEDDGASLLDPDELAGAAPSVQTLEMHL